MLLVGPRVRVLLGFLSGANPGTGRSSGSSRASPFRRASGGRGGRFPRRRLLEGKRRSDTSSPRRFRASGPILIENHEAAVMLFWAIRELLFNAAKHAQVRLTLQATLW